MKAYNNLHKVNIEKMNLPKKLIFIAVCTLWATTTFGQNFNRIYFEGKERNTFIWQVKAQIENTIISSLDLDCSNGHLCTNLIVTDLNGSVASNHEIFTGSGFFNRLQVRNDSIIYSGSFFQERDSTTYWFLGITNAKGDRIAEYVFPILHLKDTGKGSFGYQTPTNYGLTLLSNNEVMLWGEGLDNRQPNPGNVPYRSVFLRVGLDGSKKSDVFWFDINDDKKRRMSDACTDIDGNMVFLYEYRGNPVLKIARSICKIMLDNSIKLIAEIPITDLGLELPKIAVDSQGNYFINPTYISSSDIGYISKVNRAGEVLWTSMIPTYNLEWPALIGATHTNEINRISTTHNGDILCTGRVFVRDSFVVAGQVKKQYLSGNGSFIARFDTDGKLLWRHFIVPHKKDGTIRGNYIYDIQEAPDGSIITGGALERDDNDIDPSFKTDAWIMRLTTDGCLKPDCSHIGKYFDFLPEIVSVTDDVGTDKLTIYPNPGTEQINIQLAADIALPIQYQISNIQGMIVETGIQSVRDITLDGSHLVSGMYIIAIRDSHGSVLSSKWVKE